MSEKYDKDEARFGIGDVEVMLEAIVKYAFYGETTLDEGEYDCSGGNLLQAWFIQQDAGMRSDVPLILPDVPMLYLPGDGANGQYEIQAIVCRDRIDHIDRLIAHLKLQRRITECHLQRNEHWTRVESVKRDNEV